MSPSFSPWTALAGGAVIGLAASLYLVAVGRIAGISGIVAGALLPGHDDSGRGARRGFIVGLVAAGVLLAALAPSVFGVATTTAHPALLIGAGVLVGVGTRLGKGCTSGHGVCGLSHGSPRSLAAVIVFMATAALTVLVVRWLGGAP